ncbi:hypothetical protein ACRAWF_43580 [Streptomyces sp. L7]
MGGALLLVVVTGVGRSVPVWVLLGREVGSVVVVVSVPELAFASVPESVSTPESELGEVSVPCVVSVVTVLSSDVVFSGRPVVVVAEDCHRSSRTNRNRRPDYPSSYRSG